MSLQREQPSSKTYNAPAGKNRSFIDLQAFPSPSPAP